MRTAEGVRPFALSVFFISSRENVFLIPISSHPSISSRQLTAMQRDVLPGHVSVLRVLYKWTYLGKVDAKVTVSTLYARFSLATHSATSTSATCQFLPSSHPPYVERLEIPRQLLPVQTRTEKPHLWLAHTVSQTTRLTRIRRESLDQRLPTHVQPHL